MEPLSKIAAITSIVANGVRAVRAVVGAIPTQNSKSKIAVDESQHDDAVHRQVFATNRWSTEVMVRSTRRLLLDVLVSPSLYAGESRRSGNRPTSSPLSLLRTGDSFVLLGGPGAGKTTTLKMLALHVQTKEAASVNDRFDFALFVRLRDFGELDTITAFVLNMIGLRIDYDPPLDNPDGDSKSTKKMREEYASAMKFLAQVRERALVEYLNTVRCLLLLDGLDEAQSDSAAALCNELGRLVSQLTDASCIMTCRHGAYVVPVDGVDVYSMERFSPDQVASFAHKWFVGGTEKATAFLNRLARTPYSEMAEIPLHATNLCMIFDQYGDLPTEHSKIYDKLIDIRLREWDSDRGIHRIGKHEGFDHDEKRRFLSHIAFELAKAGHAVSFSVGEFANTLDVVGQKFRIEVTNVRQLLEELEAHSGIIVNSGLDQYEFIHKTIQEFLVGDYLARLPLVSAYNYFLRHMPDTCAIATLRSNDRDSFVWCMWNSLFRNDEFMSTAERLSFWIQYWNRLRTECVDFGGHKLLGLGLLDQLSSCLRARSEIQAKLAVELVHTFVALSDLRGVSQGIASAIANGEIDRATEKIWGFDFKVVTFGNRILSADALGQSRYPSKVYVPSSMV